MRHAGLPPPVALPVGPQQGGLQPGEASLLDVPSLDAPLRSDAVVDALEQLYAAYKVEHWACLEELRALHTEFKGAGGSALAPPAAAAAGGEGGDSAPAADAAAADAAADPPSADTFRELLHVLQLAPPRRGQQQGQQQQQTANGGPEHAKQAEGGDAMEVDEVHQPGTSQQQQAGGSEQGKQEPRQQQQDAASRRYGDATCGYGSDDEPPTFSDAEDAAIGAGAAGRAAGAWEQRQSGAGSGGGAGADEGQVAAWRERFRSNAGGLADLERVASAATALLMDAQGALGCLCGRNGRYLVRRTAVTLGRSTDSKGDVDVDLAREGVPGKVSRLQAQLALGRGGGWSVKNVGRRELFVNGAPLERGESAPVPHLSLLEVGGVQLLFMANPAAVQRALVRSQQLVM